MTKAASSKLALLTNHPYLSPSGKDKKDRPPNSPSKLPQSPTKKNILQVTNVLLPNGVPYGWTYLNAYDVKEQIKALCNKTGESTFIGGMEFKSFSNLTAKWIKQSVLGHLLWVVRIDEVDVSNNFCFPMSAHKAYLNKVVRAIIAQKIKCLGDIEINPDVILTETDMDNMNNVFGEMTGGGDNARDALFEEFIAEADADLEQLI